MIRRPPRSTQSRSSAASDVYKRQVQRGYREIPSSNSQISSQYTNQAQPRGQQEKTSEQNEIFSVAKESSQFQDGQQVPRGNNQVSSFTSSQAITCLLYTSPSPRDS
eukprot:TRINITY_DN6593_c0_g1_i2.p1 TRINITY_DN6593_c0_g1~~TRINITY_DN6593_c0_g1_i2.p1  ORF type:complete len:107 (-),score=45.64 TRINITY_DN6593_c0_g1_i2:38-358(-)